VHEAVSTLCIAAGADGLRADLVMLRSARALAAWEGAAAITGEHVQRVAEAVLLHRRKRGTESAPPAAAPAPADAFVSPSVSPSAGPSAKDNTSAPAPTNSGGDSSNDSNDAHDWGAMPPEPVGIERVKPLRPLIVSQQAAAKKA
jgi:magnesium chelatase subunit I